VSLDIRRPGSHIRTKSLAPATKRAYRSSLRRLPVFVNSATPTGASKKPYSTRGVRALLARYADKVGLEQNMPPHRLRHFLFTWLKAQGLDDALIQPYSGHTSRKSLEIYSRLSLAGAQESYDEAISRFPV